MKKGYIVVLQIITLLLMISNHFIGIILRNDFEIYLFWLGMSVTSFIVDIMLYVTIGLQLFIIFIIIGGKRNDA